MCDAGAIDLAATTSRQDRPACEAAPQPLEALLRARFGHEGFRPHQREVCAHVAAGGSALLVMPTGAGKSLCYQLPGLARGGTTLVISPLIALMEDQVAKLQALGLRAERIHSGRARTASRAVCADYLAGQLSFLFIAPERLAVPRFPEFLARRPLALIAVDEAHCISHWGHDFRPDYRLFARRLPQLQAAPVIALTATATPLVQQDIVEQLGIGSAPSFIHGFRRGNIAVEVLELAPRERGGAVRRILDQPDRLPAIVYAPTRRQTESLAQALCDGGLAAAAYHAGMEAGERDAVHARFAAGELAVIVATIAFGMGIDKADIRTVIHTALPGSVEGYYQEIGRAGRDGAPSRAVLMHSYGDRRTHEHFFARDYPEPALLADVLARLPERGAAPRAVVAQQLGALFDEATLERALDVLRISGGMRVDADGALGRGSPDWRRRYEEQREAKRDQLARITRYAGLPSCRMLQLVEHFGDTGDSGEPCGQCDVCAPAGAALPGRRGVFVDEVAACQRILRSLRAAGGALAAGRLYEETFTGAAAGVDRPRFEALLDALARARLARVESRQFARDEQTIRYRRVRLSRAGEQACDEPESLAAALGVTERPPAAPGATARDRRGGSGGDNEDVTRGAAAPELCAALRDWRRETAKRRKLPAYVVLDDRTLAAVAEACPRTEEQLLAVAGIGPKRCARYGEALLAIVGAHAEG